MTDEELLAFINRVQAMCAGNIARTSAAFRTLEEILEQHHVSPEKIGLVSGIKGSYGTQELHRVGRVETMDDVKQLIQRARDRQRIDEAHRGCR